MKEGIGFFSRELKQKFIKENVELREEDRAVPVQGHFNEITDDDEVWLVQCPKNMDLTALANQKIKLPGKSSYNNLETIALEFPEPSLSAFGYRNKKQNFLKLINIQGSLIVREKLKQIKTEYVPGEPQQKVPVPQNLTERHPLLGVDYKEKLKLDATIQKRLEESRNFPMIKKKSSRKINIAKCEVKVESDEEDVQFVSEGSAVKKPKNKKRKLDSESDSSSNFSKKPKKEVTNGDDISLQWIKNI